MVVCVVYSAMALKFDPQLKKYPFQFEEFNRNACARANLTLPTSAIHATSDSGNSLWFDQIESYVELWWWVTCLKAILARKRKTSFFFEAILIFLNVLRIG